MNPSPASVLLLGVKILGDRSISPVQGVGMLILVYAVALFVGLLICSQLKWGFGFESLPVDGLKCLAVGAIVVLALWVIEVLLIGAVGTVVHVRLFMIAVIYLATKVCWREIKFRENLLANALAVAAAGVTFFFLAGRVAT